MPIEWTGKALRFTGFFTSDRQAKTGLAVTCNVYRGSTLILTGVSATEVGDGFYDYVMDASLNPADTYSEYRAKMHTSDDTVDMRDVPCQWSVTEWADVIKRIKGPGASQYQVKVADSVSHNGIPGAVVWISKSSDPEDIIAGMPFTTDLDGMMNPPWGVWLDEGVHVYFWCFASTHTFDNPVQWTTAGTPSPFVIEGLAAHTDPVPNFKDLLDALRIRLNDLDKGNYTDDELKQHINLAYRETQQTTRCYKHSIDLNLIDGEPLYYINTVFDPIDVSAGGVVLHKATLGDLSAGSSLWNSQAKGTPEKWVQQQGNTIRIWPSPEGTGVLRVHGYAIAPDMAADIDTPSAIPSGFAVSAILDRAESEARKTRPTWANNASLYQQLYSQWQMWCAKIEKAIAGDK